MSDTHFQNQVLDELKKIHNRFDTLETKVDKLSSDLSDFQTNQEQFNTAIWNLNTQAFSAINDIRSEVVSPWKIRQSQKQ